MEIRYLDNSGFAVFLQNTTLIIDYFNNQGEKDQVIGLDDLNCNQNTYVLSSHRHLDHFNKCVFDFAKENKNIKYILDTGIRRARSKTDLDITFVSQGKNYTDDAITIKAFGSTDEGVSFLIRAEGKVIFHAGDLNFWHWKQEADHAYVENERKKFMDILNDIQKENIKIDLMFFPVDYRMGEEGDMGAKIMLQVFHPNIFVPMHFSNQFDKIHAFKKSMCEYKIWDIGYRGEILRDI